MDNSSTVPSASEDASEPTPEVEVIEIDLQNLSPDQKKSLLVVLGSFVVQIIFLFNMKIITDFFKIPVATSFQIVSDYVVDFLNTFVLYLLVISLIVAIYVSYVLLVNDSDYLKVGLEAFDTIVKVLVLDFAFYFVSLVIITPLNSIGQANPIYPNALELFIFIFMVLLLIAIPLSPFYVLDYLKRENSYLRKFLRMFT